MYDWDHEIEDLSSIIGKTPVAIWQTDFADELYFKFNDGSVLKLCHEQDCCESVNIEDVVGDWADLLGNPILVADERTDTDSPKSCDGWTDESSTWTFYTFRGIGGSVDVRWYGQSNGYYSERVTAYFFSKNVAEKRNINPPT